MVLHFCIFYNLFAMILGIQRSFFQEEMFQSLSKLAFLIPTSSFGKLILIFKWPLLKCGDFFSSEKPALRIYVLCIFANDA